MKPILQVALDFVDLPRAIKVAEEAIKGGADFIEAGTPLIKSEGLNAVRELKRLFGNHTIVADMKTIDTGRLEVECALKAGAKIVHILGNASDSTIRECVEAAANYGGKIIVDLIEIEDKLKRAKELEKLGVDYICVHTSIDRQMRAETPFAELKKIRENVSIPLAVAGGINSETAAAAVKNGASIIIVGGAIIKSVDATEATRKIREAIDKQIVIKTELYKRTDESNVFDILYKVSTANISDAMHRRSSLVGIYPIINNTKMVGKAVTVRCYPGDWAKTVEAIEIAKENDVIVIDAGGAPPSVWGELATHSCVVKGVKGVVINGAIRDVEEIRQLKFPAFAKMITSAAGEPRGFGEINIPINISGIRINPGDFIVGDDDGVIVIEQNKVVEVANRAMDVLEKENRLRKEIKEGKTLSEVAYLQKWEKR